MVFKRRDRRPVWQVVADFIYPRGGWSRAAQYVKHRVRRLPDTPEKISRGVWAGVFTAFTPFYSMHFVVAFLLARLMRGNVLAALMGTFFGNPLTYVPIAVASLGTGHWLLGTRPVDDVDASIGAKFGGAFHDLWHNFLAIFTPARADWHGLAIFYDEVFYPYMIGGIIPGIICATFCYYLSVPLISAYQKRRQKVLRAKLASLQKNTGQNDDGGPTSG
ncbi:MAG: DUF2062 domain-containing protein [Yoonia sp.]|uniref:DUF2062 domain-containing protein n=1 Tax=Rhodobacterales TaxID=204455 RepID=UPI001FF0EBCF|nr:DUF2062 domain-containing protein [Loktanella sp. F6476L]MCK0121955.1 DUF2062 domain-containing protein [Loktanella sp. F6476L]UWR00108.1 DUF2062 domain-containing protein [Rhodobacteraceae bacterium S2214]